MMKERYERTELDVIEFKNEDVILSSNLDDQYEGERVVISLPLR